MTSAHVAARPRLRHGTIISRSHENAVLAMVGDTCYDISVEEGSKETLLELKRYLDGTYTPEQIAASLGLPEEDVVEVVETFARLDLLADPVRTDRVARESFLRKIDQTVTMWRRQISYHPLFAALETGNARVEVLHGLMIETSHFVRSAPTHIATALAHCTDPRWRAMLTNYLVEECDHERYVLQVTTAMGYDPERVRSANPVIGTTSLIANLCRIARETTLGYFLCLRLLEGQAESRSQAIASLRHIAKRYGFGPEIVEPIARHALIDVEAGHASLLDEALEGFDALDAREVHLAVNAIHDLKHSLDQFYDQLLQYYVNPTSYVPRPLIDYFCL
ncbi:MAG TPA: iron-containing redox enzyme family protein [Thermoanaerobaculia bacterium]|jgi:pyrroloquinoline quinone (PQQ) biosynthesis protein C